MIELNIEDIIKKPTDLFSALMYGSYASNRDEGMTNEQLLSIGIGNEEMKLQYEKEKAKLKDLFAFVSTLTNDKN